MRAQSGKRHSSNNSRDRYQRNGGRRELFEKSGEEILQILNKDAGKRTPDRKYQSRYLEVLNAAAKLFSIKGYQSATTTHIAEELGIQQASLYYYLKSKEQALEQICEIAVEGYVRFSQRIKASRAPPVDKLRKLIFSHLITLEQRPRFFKVFQDNRKDLGEAARHKIGRQVRTYEENVEAIIIQGIRTGALRQDLNPIHAKLFLIGLCNSVSIWWGVRSDARISVIANEIADIFLGGAAAKAKE
jgi:AcrR family transcriptional regulator